MPIRPADHPHADPGDGRTECDVCGKWIFEAIHSCKRVPVTQAAWLRYRERVAAQALHDSDGFRDGRDCHHGGPVADTEVS